MAPGILKQFYMLVAFVSLISFSYSQSKKNVVIFLVDDLGYKDLACYGSNYHETPNIDKLSGDGTRFIQGYSTCAVCTPTRASMLTGKYPARLMMTCWLPGGRWNAQKHTLREGRYHQALPLTEITLAEALREHGYKNAFIGKWHLGGEPFYYPQHQGFDVNIAGCDHGNPGNYFFPFKGKWKIPTTGKYAEWQTYSGGKQGDYLTDVLTDEAVKFIQNQNSPFMLYFSYYGVHTPFQAKKDKVEKYSKKAPQFPKHKHIYAGMVESIDDSVGRVINSLKEKGIYEDTLIIFTSDNGGHAKASDHTPLRGNKGSYYEGGIRVPLIVKAPNIKPGVSNELACSNDIYPTVLDALKLPAKEAQHIDGISLLPAMKGKKLQRKSLYWHFPHYNNHPNTFPCGVVRKGNWKLIKSYDPDKTELYNLKEDISEKENLSESKPKIVSELLNDLNEWKKSVGADEMKINPEYKK